MHNKIMYIWCVIKSHCELVKQSLDIKERLLRKLVMTILQVTKQLTK